MGYFLRSYRVMFFTVYRFGVRSWLFIARNPTEVIFGGLIVYSIGGMLEQTFGKNHFCSGARPALCKVALSPFSARYCSRWALSPIRVSAIMTTLWIIYGLWAERSRYPLYFWGVPLRGKTFALIGLGFAVLNGAFSSFFLVLPDLISAALCYA